MSKSSMAGKVWSFEMLRVLHAHRPIKRVLDVGAGMVIYTQFRRPGQHWTAVEIWGPFVKAYDLASKYDHVVVGDMLYMDWRKFAPLDLVLCGDVLEHMTKDNALDILNHALDHARVVLVSIPIVHSEQNAIYGNPYEVHVKPDWSHEECVSSFPSLCAGYCEDGIGVYFMSRIVEDIEALQAIGSGKLTAPRGPADAVTLTIPSGYHPDLV